MRTLSLTLALTIAVALPLAGSTATAEPPRRHALAKIGDPATPADFKHFSWVQPDAPKGGSVRLSAIGSFDTLNSFSIQGVTAPALSALVDATLMAPSPDEPATAYGLIAEWVSVADDISSVTFGLRASARFADGTPVTAEDVIFSFEEQKRAAPAIAIYYRDVTRAERTGDREVTFHFARKGARDLPYAVGLLTVIPRHFWSGKTPGGEPRDLAKSTLEVPIGAGPYRVKALDRGRSITYERVKDWWAKDLPVNIGQFNFDELHFIMFRDDVPEFEALKAGEIDLKEENSSKKWATAYTFPASRDGRVKKLELGLKTVAQLQGFSFNLRKAKFADPRVRRAIGLAYDFESANRSLFYGLYRRLDSYFDNSELAAKGLPEGRELALLEPLRDKVPPEVFTTEFRSPRNDTAEDFRRNLRDASRLLDEAGWKLDGNVRRHERTGEPLTIEFLSYDTQFDRIVLPFKQNLAKIGVDLVIRVNDATQYENRLKTYDFEMITDAFPQSHAPGPEQLQRWGSAAADQPATANRIGIKNPAIDALLEEMGRAGTREELIAATRALDRVMLWNHYMILQWYNPTTWIAHWDKFGRPARHPSQDPSVLTTWWIDQSAVAKLGQADGKK